MRHSEVSRETAETAVKLSLELDGSGRAEVHTGVGFLDHMLTLFACHGGSTWRSAARATWRWTRTTAWRTSASALAQQ